MCARANLLLFKCEWCVRVVWSSCWGRGFTRASEPRVAGCPAIALPAGAAHPLSFNMWSSLHVRFRLHCDSTPRLSQGLLKFCSLSQPFDILPSHNTHAPLPPSPRNVPDRNPLSTAPFGCACTLVPAIASLCLSGKTEVFEENCCFTPADCRTVLLHFFSFFLRHYCWKNKRRL